VCRVCIGSSCNVVVERRDWNKSDESSSAMSLCLLSPAGGMFFGMWSEIYKRVGEACRYVHEYTYMVVFTRPRQDQHPSVQDVED
jgi:hypothetical protein